MGWSSFSKLRPFRPTLGRSVPAGSHPNPAVLRTLLSRRVQKEDYWRETAGLLVLVLVLLLVIGERFGRVVPLGIVRPWLDP